jgi:hypothetical protein
VPVRVVSTAATAAAAGPPVGSVVGASVVATATIRVTAATAMGAVRDDLTLLLPPCEGLPAFARVRLG